MISAASSSFGSCVRTAIAVARSMPPSRWNASSGHAATTSSASGKRAGWAKRARGSTTNARQPVAAALGALGPHQLVGVTGRLLVERRVPQRALGAAVVMDEQLLGPALEVR